MKRSNGVWTAALVAVFFAVAVNGCAGGPTDPSTGEFLDDRVITTKVKSQLFESEEVSGFDINVDTFKGMVTLNGVVGSNDQKREAERLARSVSGVKEVKNYLEVRTE